MLPTGSPTSGSHGAAALLFLGAVVTAVLSWLGVRSTRAAPLQEAVNDALRLFMEQSQTQHALDAVRVSELEAECLEKGGRIRQLEQQRDSLLAVMHRAGIAVPGEETP